PEWTEYQQMDDSSSKKLMDMQSEIESLVGQSTYLADLTELERVVGEVKGSMDSMSAQHLQMDIVGAGQSEINSFNSTIEKTTKKLKEKQEKLDEDIRILNEKIADVIKKYKDEITEIVQTKKQLDAQLA